jgi:ethanolamine transporter EutH
MWLNAFICDRISGKRVGYNNMIYDETEIERIARVAGKFHLCLLGLHVLVYLCTRGVDKSIHITGLPSYI